MAEYKKIHIMEVTIDDLTRHANGVKWTVLDGLQKERLLTPEQAQKFDDEYVVIVIRQGIFSRLIDSLFNNDDKPSMRYQLVKLIR